MCDREQVVVTSTSGFIYDKIQEIDRINIVYDILQVDERAVHVKKPCTCNGESSYYYASYNAKQIKGSVFIHKETKTWDPDPLGFYITETSLFEKIDTNGNVTKYNLIESKELITDSDDLILLASLNGIISNVDEFKEILQSKLDELLKYRKTIAPYVEIELSGTKKAFYFEYGDFWINFNINKNDNMSFGISGVVNFDDNDIPVSYNREYHSSQPIIKDRMQEKYIEFAIKNDVKKIDNGYIINNTYYETIEEYTKSIDD